MLEEFVWTEKYRPKTIAECILPEKTRAECAAMVAQGNLPNLLLAGGPGIGKTTVAKAMISEIGSECMVINASLYGNIDTIRNEIQDYATSSSFDGKRKYVILDEADGINANSQRALRAFMEEYSANCGFILTCNNKKRLHGALGSRIAEISFDISKKETPKVAAAFMKRVEGILKTENVEYDRAVVASLITKFFPDLRRTLNEFQKFAAAGKIDSGTLTNTSSLRIDEVLDMCKDKRFDDLRKWVAENSDIDANSVMESIYDRADARVAKGSIPLLILKIADYEYRGAFVADQQILLLAFFVELLSEIEFV